MSSFHAITKDRGPSPLLLETLGLSPNGMRDMKQLVKQLNSSLVGAGFHETSNSDCLIKNANNNLSTNYLSEKQYY